jgi:hypothetical protein
MTKQTTLAQLDERERQIIFECLRAAADGPFFPEWEFHTLFGLERKEVKHFAEMCPEIDDSNEQAAKAISNSMNHLIGYPHKMGKAWQEFISASPSEVERIFRKWRELHNEAKCHDD